MCPVPATQYTNVLNVLNSMARSGGNNEFQLTWAKTEARKLLDLDRVEGFILFGVIACLEGDIPAMHDQHQSALQWAVNSTDKSEALFQYATSLSNIEEYSPAFALVLKALEAEENLNFFFEAVGFAMDLGLKNVALGFKRHYEKLSGKKHKHTKAAIMADNGRIRPSVTNIVTKNLAEHEELWKRLADA